MRYRIPRRSSNQHGFSLPEILIVMGIVGFVMAAILSLLEFSAKGARVQRVAVQASDLREDIRGVLASPDACKLTFAAVDLNSAKTSQISFTAILDQSGAHVFDVAKPDKENVLQITSISMLNYVDVDANTGRAEVKIGVEAMGAKQGVQMPFKDRTIALKISKNSANKLTSCVSLAGMNDGIWRQSANSDYNIFYTGGNVGVGTPAPQAALHVVGNIWAKPDCHTVTAMSAAATFIATAVCADNEYVMTGGGQCLNSGVVSFSGTTIQGVLVSNEPQGNSWLVQCYDVTNDFASPSQAFAVCCRNGN